MQNIFVILIVLLFIYTQHQTLSCSNKPLQTFLSFVLKIFDKLGFLTPQQQ